MARRFSGDRLLVATHNHGKLEEVAHLLAPHGVAVLGAADMDLPEPEETEDSFVGNARIKAHAAARATGLPALADDSGIEIDALGGAPGVHTADWAEIDPEGPRDFAAAMARVERELKARGAGDFSARFVCCLCLAWPDGHEESFFGEATGRVVFPPRGDRGFGYDPIFVADGETLTFGEMEPAKKHDMSHRADAFSQLVEVCLK